MGDEARTTLSFRGRASDGKALLEPDELVFRGEFRLRIPLADVRSVEAEDGRLAVVFGDGTATFELGPKAAHWAERIRNPRTLLDKLGVKPGIRVALVGIADADFRRHLEERAGGIVDERGLAPGGTNLVFLGADGPGDLERLPALIPFLEPAGGIWVVAPKGGAKPTEADVLAAGRAAGLTDVKVARFSATHTAHKFVIPGDRR